jgi:ABC-type antimicrobial peptide transport system permease subunit
MALGARQPEVTRIFVGHGFVLALVGVTCGLAGAVGLTRVLGSLLYGVSAIDPLTYIAVATGLIAAAVIASYIPALRATAVDPIDALKRLG